MSRQKQSADIKTLLIIGTAVLFCYFFSGTVLKQFILHRAGTKSISLSSILGKLPPGVRDEVTRRIAIAEYRDELKEAKTVEEKIRISIALAAIISPEELQKKYAEIIDKYPTFPEAQPAFLNFFMAPPNALKVISIEDYYAFMQHLKREQKLWAWNQGFLKLKKMNLSNERQIEFLLPLLEAKPEGREYQQLYRELSELAFEEGNQDIELKAKKFEEICENLPFFDELLEKQAKEKAKKNVKNKSVNKTTTKKREK